MNNQIRVLIADANEGFTAQLSGFLGENPAFAVAGVANDGEKAVETVRLDASNNWSYTWTDLAARGNWQITEINIPKGYTPSYQVKDGVITVTNTATLIQTGQLNWPIAVLGGLGLVLISLGGILIFRKKKNRRV